MPAHKLLYAPNGPRWGPSPAQSAVAAWTWAGHANSGSMRRRLSIDLSEAAASLTALLAIRIVEGLSLWPV